MHRVTWILSVLVGFGATLALPAEAQEEQPIAVYVTGRTGVQPLDKQAKKARKKTYRDRRKAKVIGQTQSGMNRRRARKYTP